MNLKKSPVDTQLSKQAQEGVTEDKKYIQEQYSLYNPDITVCCGTGWDLRWVLDLNESEVYETTRGINWFLILKVRQSSCLPPPRQEFRFVVGLWVS